MPGAGGLCKHGCTGHRTSPVAPRWSVTLAGSVLECFNHTATCEGQECESVATSSTVNISCVNAADEGQVNSPACRKPKQPRQKAAHSGAGGGGGGNQLLCTLALPPPPYCLSGSKYAFRPPSAPEGCCSHNRDQFLGCNIHILPHLRPWQVLGGTNPAHPPLLLCPTYQMHQSTHGWKWTAAGKMLDWTSSAEAPSTSIMPA